MNQVFTYPDIWLAYVDLTEDEDRESWSVFYVEPFVALSEQNVQKLAEAHVIKLATQAWKDNDKYGQVSDYKADFHIEIKGPYKVHP